MQSNLLTASISKDNLAFLVKRYSDDIAAFAIDLFGFDRFDAWQLWLFDAMLSQDDTKIAIASCHSSGKTMLSCIIALHRILCFKESRTIITSVTEAQLKLAFQTTLHTLIEQSVIKDWFSVSAEQITVKGVKGSWIRLQAWSEARSQSFAGLHCNAPLYIFDEASGIHPSIFKAASGSMMHPYSKMLLLGNPTHREGELFDAFHDKKNSYKHIHVSAYDSSFISERWIEEMKAEYGEGSDQFKIRVLGEFPDHDITTFIPASMVDNAINRAVVEQHMHPVVGGLDVGQYRDASVLTIRQGSKVLGIHHWYSREPMFVANEVHRLISKYTIDITVCDENGVGAGVGSRLRELGNSVFPVQHKNFKSTVPEYFNVRAQIWGKAKNWLKYGSIPNEKDLISELKNMPYVYDALGRYKMVPKKDLESSPDFGDSFTYTFAVDIDLLMRKKREEKAYRKAKPISLDIC